MPIQILDFPDPLTPAAKESSARRVLIQSNEYRQLVHELRSYCNAQISGRSFLIAGHRGSGKTTLTLSAFEQVWRDAGSGRLRMRPLLVQLLGPSLLPESDERDIAEPAQSAASVEKKLTEFENVLVQFTLALHRAVVNELTDEYRRRMEDLASAIGKEGRIDVERVNACLEAPGQLALELDEYPGKARLRQFWQRARALPQGLLPIPRRAGVGEKQEVINQGVNELVALCSVSEAYRRISGTIQATKKDGAAAQDSTAMTRETEFKGKELFGPLITLLTGGVVATGVAAFQPGRWELAAIAGVLTAFASAVVAKYSISRSQQRSSSREELFLPNLSVATLDRVLPVLLDRVRDAGLAPVFVIDELDKVEDLSERIPKMVKRLKKLVAEKAFFCFLTDRRYFEEMSLRNAKTPYSEESTYFTNQVFITFRHTDYHSFIGELLRKPEPTARPDASLEGFQSSVDLDEEIIDHALLPYILLHAAQMHPIDLRRRVSSYRGENGAVTLAAGEIRNVFNRLQVLVQVAIEVLLESPEMELELERDPAFRRLAHDALYFISREWQRGAEKLHLDATGRQGFETYFSERMIPERGARSPRNEPQRARFSAKERKGVRTGQFTTAETEQAEARDRAEELPESQFTGEEANFLWGKVCELGVLLAGSPQKIHEQAVAKNVGSIRWPHGRFARPVLDAVISIPGSLLERIGETGIFRFRYHRAGRPSEIAESPKMKEERRAPHAEKETVLDLPPKPGEKALRLKRALIRKFDSTLRKLTGGTINCGILGASLGVIRTSPRWNSVKAALTRLAGRTKEYPEKVEDISNVEQFVDLLKSSANTVALAIFCGWVVGSALKKESEEGNEKDGEKRSEEGSKKGREKGSEFAGLQLLSQALGLKTLPEEKVKMRIQQFGDDIVKRLKLSKPEIPQIVDASSVELWSDVVKLLKTQAEPTRDDALRINLDAEVKGWNFWRIRLIQPDLPADFETVICAAAGKGPSRLLNFPPEEMTARAWSKALYESMISFQTDEKSLADASEHPVPHWLASEALRQLGFTIDPQALVRIGLADSKDVAAADVESFKVSVQTNELKRNAIILSREGGESENWKAGKEWAVLVWHDAELNRLRKWLPRLFPLMRLEWLVFDWSVLQSSQSGSEALTFLPGEVLKLIPAAATQSLIPVIVPRDWKGALPSNFFSIPVPQSLDELFTIIARARTLNAPT